ncbi:TetR family transcriptional regulator [Nocardia seriolae]|uniref:TetR family transcriptional regulator n=1 Tax=Nocardia seriolae TaxID=37332 RepID=UPI000A4F4CB4|nr:TetR family transcriptional regulator [Nocardia seriolae]QUN16294.1 TetR family transcriptional regulator [Nocardia seriolae]WKY55132.1 TetR family transcriptional regulator [Nocardia seriolae]WNJ56652.1 TetR family transcriptional regulator [Nocardia seriolae]
MASERASMTMTSDRPRAGRPALSEARRAATRREVALAAAHLFIENSYTATTVEDIAAAAGMGLRTFYRYFATKEDVLAPLLAIGTQAWADELAACPPDLPLREALARSYRTATTRTLAAESIPESRLRPLVRAATQLPALRATWLRVHQDCEAQLIPIIAARTGSTPDDLDVALTAAMANTAVRLATERWAATDEPGSAADFVDTCLIRLATHSLL